MTELEPDQDGLVVVKSRLVPKGRQPEFFNVCEDPAAEEILFSGSIRGGKTQGCCEKIVAWAWHYGGPGWKAGIFRKTYPELRDSVKGVMLRGDGGLPPTLPPELVAYERVSDEMVVLKNGAEILFRSLEQPREAEEKIRNVTFGAMFIDQIEELDGPEYLALYETMVSRLSDPRGPRKMLAAANPGPTTHWVYERFHPESDKRQEQTRYVHVTLHDNKEQLPPDYLNRQERRRKADPMWYDRFILGKWGAFGGRRFKSFSQERHLVDPFDIPGSWEIVEGIDYGWQNLTVVEWMAIDPHGLEYLVAEHAEAQQSVKHHSKKIREIRERYNLQPSLIVLDPAAWAQQREYASVAEEFMECGIEVSQADNDRLGGWNRLDEHLGGSDGGDMVADPYRTDHPGGVFIPRLRIFRDRCPEFVRELPAARVKPGTDDIVKKNDHALDAARYILNSKHDPGKEDDAEEDLDPRERYARRRFERAEERAAPNLVYG